jgi:general secretion pathway protein M
MLTTPWISRAVALLLLVSVVAALYLWAAEPLVAAYSGTDEAIAEARSMLERFDRIGAARAKLTQEAASLDTQTTTTLYYLAAGTDAMAAAALQGQVKSLIESSGGTVGSMQTLPTRQEQRLQRVALRLQMTATMSSLFHVLHDLETGMPLLFLDNLDIQGRLRQSSQANGQEQEQEPELTVGFEVYGYLPPVAGESGTPSTQPQATEATSP